MCGHVSVSASVAGMGSMIVIRAPSTGQARSFMAVLKESRRVAGYNAMFEVNVDLVQLV